MKRWLHKKIHVSWFIAWVSFGFLAGVTLCLLPWSAKIDSFWLLILAAAFLLITLYKQSRIFIFAAIAAGLALGLYRGIHTRHAADYSNIVGRYVYLSGTVADDATHKNNQTGLKLSGIKIANKKLGGELWIGVEGNKSIKRDYKVEVYGKLKPGFGNFAASLSYAKLILAKAPAHPNRVLQIRDNFASGLRKAVPEPQASLGLGYLTGQHNNLSSDLIKQLQVVGLIHLVIAGGYNVTILVRFARRLLSKVSRYLALLASSGILLGLILMSGFSAPVSRTVIVTGVCLGAWYYGHKIHPLVLLPVAAAITAWLNPAFVWGDVGWYLTFVAYSGLIILGPMLKKFFWGKNSSGTIKQIVVDTVSVQIVTMPILALAFHQYSIYGLPANLLVLPLMPLTMLFIATAGVGGMILPASLAHLLGWPATQLLGYTLHITTWLATQPAAGLTANLTYTGLVAAYALAAAGGYLLWRKTHYNFRAESLVE